MYFLVIAFLTYILTVNFTVCQNITIDTKADLYKYDGSYSTESAYGETSVDLSEKSDLLANLGDTFTFPGLESSSGLWAIALTGGPAEDRTLISVDFTLRNTNNITAFNISYVGNYSATIQFAKDPDFNVEGDRKQLVETATDADWENYTVEVPLAFVSTQVVYFYRI